jgi:site-specific DNA recombinase
VRAAIYARVSSAAQREAHTIENQLRVLPAFVAAQGWELAGTWVDDGRSAKSGMLDQRDGFADLVRAAEARKFDLLVVVDVDRLTRTNSIEERALILGPFQRLGIDIVTPSGGRLDMRTMLGELWITIQALGAAEENRKRSERIKAGKLRAIAEGRKPSGPTPYGYRYSRTNGTWSLHPGEALIVHEIFLRVASGDACIAIADDLTCRGIPAPRTTWSMHPVYRIVKNRVAVGEWTADKKRGSIIKVPAIVTEEEWHAADRALFAHRKRGLVKTLHVYLLDNGLARCGACGANMVVRSATGPIGHRNEPAYVCRARRDRHACDAPIPKIPATDARVWVAICEELEQPDLLAALANVGQQRAGDLHDWTSDADTHRSHLARLEKVEAAIMARFRRGSISEGALDVELAALSRERRMVRGQLATAEKAMGSTVSAQARLRDAAGLLEQLRAALPLATPTLRRELVRTLIEPGGVTFRGTTPVLDLRLRLEASAASHAEASVSLAPVTQPFYRTRSEANGVTLRIRRLA